MPPTSSSEPIVELDRAGRRHPDGRNWLLDGVSLRIEPGARIVLTGPSGGGKTLLLRAIARLDPLDRGQVRYRGHPIRNDAVPRFRSEVIYLHQRAVLIEDTVEAALRRPLDLRIHRDRRFNQDAVRRFLADLGRDADFTGKRVSDLSGGEIQITALVRALQLDPTILLLDEPTAALDGPSALAFERVIDRWLGERSDRAMVWVSHNEAQAHRVGKSFLRIENGKLAG